MSANHPKADIREREKNVRYVPKETFDVPETDYFSLTVAMWARGRRGPVIYSRAAVSTG
jgi:hypothetical protein